MRILHLLAERGFSGGEVQLRHILRHLQEQGHDNRLVLQPGAEFAATARELGIPVEEVRMRNSFDLLASLRLRGIVRRSGADLVQFACSRSHKLGALATVGMAPPPYRVVTRRMDYPLRRGWSRWLYGSAVHAAVVISRGVQAELERVGVPRDHIELIYEGVDPDRFAGLAGHRDAARQALGLAPDALVVLCGASLTRRKGQVHLLRAFATLCAQHPRAHLLLAGDGPERAALVAERARLGVEARVTLPGWLDVEQVMAASDVACMPSLREGLSVFCLEAQAAGLPVVASRVGGLPESVAHDLSGLLVAPGDEAGLAVALGRLLGDADLRREMGAAAQARVRAEFDAGGMAQKTEAFYRKLIRSRAGSISES